MSNINENEKFQKTVINWFPGHMAKARREIKENINLVDIVYEVIDSRMPLSSKIVDIEELIGNKDRILIMTKYDLCDKEETNKFIEYYKNHGYKVLPVDLINMKDISKEVLNISNETFNNMNEIRKNKGLKPRALRAMVIGVPNAGKSTLINRLVNKKATNVGNKPGVTKNLSWIRIIDPEQLANYILQILYNLYPERIKERYGITNIDFNNIFDFYESIGNNRGALLKENKVDYEKVFSIIINDLKNNKFGNITFDRIEELD